MVTHPAPRGKAGISRPRPDVTPPLSTESTHTATFCANGRILRTNGQPLSAPAIPIGNRLNPVVDDFVFRMLGHKRGLAANFCDHLRIAQARHPMLYRTQPLPTHGLAAR